MLAAVLPHLPAGWTLGRVDKAEMACTALMAARAPRCLIAIVATAPIGVLGPEACLGAIVVFVARQQCLGARGVQRAVLSHVPKAQQLLSICHIDLNG